MGKMQDGGGSTKAIEGTSQNMFLTFVLITKNPIVKKVKWNNKTKIKKFGKFIESHIWWDDVVVNSWKFGNIPFYKKLEKSFFFLTFHLSVRNFEKMQDNGVC